MVSRAIIREQRAQSMSIRFGIASLFWIAAYVVLTVHAKLDATSTGALFSEARTIATAAGTAMLLSILMLWERLGTLDIMLRLKMVAMAIGASCVAMYAVRLVVAREFGNYGDTELADGGRWVIAWAGYFLATVSTYVAWTAIRDADAVRAELTRQTQRYACTDDPFGLAR